MKKLSNIIKFIFEHPLSGRHKLKAIYKFLKWQTSQLIYRRLVVKPFVGNTRLWAIKGMEAATGNIYTGLHEFNEMGFLLHFLQPEDNFVDVGANIGAYSILASGVAGARSISIEPVPATFKVLQKNIELNSLNTKILALNMGIGSGEKDLYFTDNKSTCNHVVLNVNQPEKGLVKVTVNSLEKLLENEQVPSLIKIDVEGFEQEVINGAGKILRNENLKAIIIELIGGGERYGFDEENIHGQLLKYGFLPYQYFPFERRLTNTTTQLTNNSIYLRDIEFVKNRIKNARPVSVFSESF